MWQHGVSPEAMQTNCFFVIRTFLLCVTSFTLLGTARAEVFPVAWYRLGEADPGGLSGMTVNTTSQDSVGSRHLARYGTPRYTNAVSTTAAFAVDSSLAVSFDGSAQYLSNSVVTMETDNFGIEAWVRPGAANAGTFY